MRPPTMTLADMAWTECLGWTIKEDFELAKGEVGIARSKITKLRGKYHQITLSLLPLAFMKGLQRRWGGAVSPVSACQRSGSSWTSYCLASSGTSRRRSPGCASSTAHRLPPIRSTGGAGCVTTPIHPPKRRCSTGSMTSRMPDRGMTAAATDIMEAMHR